MSKLLLAICLSMVVVIADLTDAGHIRRRWRRSFDRNPVSRSHIGCQRDRGAGNGNASGYRLRDGDHRVSHNHHGNVDGYYQAGSSHGGSPGHGSTESSDRAESESEFNDRNQNHESTGNPNLPFLPVKPFDTNEPKIFQQNGEESSSDGGFERNSSEENDNGYHNQQPHNFELPEPESGHRNHEIGYPETESEHRNHEFRHPESESEHRNHEFQQPETESEHRNHEFRHPESESGHRIQKFRHPESESEHRNPEFQHDVPESGPEHRNQEFRHPEPQTEHRNQEFRHPEPQRYHVHRPFRFHPPNHNNGNHHEAAGHGQEVTSNQHGDTVPKSDGASGNDHGTDTAAKLPDLPVDAIVNDKTYNIYNQLIEMDQSEPPSRAKASKVNDPRNDRKPHKTITSSDIPASLLTPNTPAEAMFLYAAAESGFRKYPDMVNHNDGSLSLGLYGSGIDLSSSVYGGLLPSPSSWIYYGGIPGNLYPRSAGYGYSVVSPGFRSIVPF